jgi:hypothetical protein
VEVARILSDNLIVTGDSGRVADILAYWHAIEMFDPQGIPEPPKPAAASKRKPGSKCVERIRLARLAPVPPLPWQPEHPRAAEAPARGTYGSEWRHTVYGGVFSYASVRKTFERVLGYAEQPDHGGRRKDIISALFAFTVDKDGRLIEGTEVFSSCAWSAGRLNRPGPGAPGWLDGFDKATRECEKAMRRLFARQVRYSRPDAPAQPNPGRDWVGVVTDALGAAAAGAVTALIGAAAPAIVGPVGPVGPVGARMPAAAVGPVISRATERAEQTKQDGSAQEAGRPGPAAAGATGQSRAVQVPDVVALAAHLAHVLGLPPGIVDHMELRVASTTVYRRKDGSLLDPEPVFLSSMIAPDIQRVRDAATADEGIGPALADYLSEPLGQTARTDLAIDRSVLLDGVRPVKFPLARWPASTDRALVVSQQFAVNTILAKQADRPGLFAVNGPPGTGKTTLLRDLIAAIVVQRAQALAALPNPEAGFPRECRWRAPDGTRRSVWQPHADLTGFEIVVASSNNAAVENVTKELPALKAIGEEWRAGAGYFAKPATAFLREPAWGAVAAPLGNAEKRKEFREGFWFAPGGMQQLLRALEREPPPPGEWRSAVQRFAGALARASDMAAQRAAADEALRYPIDATAVRAARHAAAEARADLNRKAQIASRSWAEATRLEGMERAGLEFRHQHEQARPRGLRTVLDAVRGGPETAAWRVRAEQLDVHLGQLTIQLAAQRKAVQEARTQEKGARQAAVKAERDAADLEARRVRQQDQLPQAVAKWGSAVPANWLELSQDEQERAAPWSDGEWVKARTKVFLAALDLHRAFVEATAPRILQNMRHLFALLSRDPSAPKDEAATAAWQTLFLLVPVISTTFASCGRMFGSLGREQLGWLFIDEAGQALPQAAVGALWRSRRAVVLGDPQQLAPISQVPPEIQGKLRGTFGIAAQWQPSATSAQGLADRRNQWGTTIRGADGLVWVGSPLRVHRRCEEPMFGVSNAIAYGGLMVYGTGGVPFPGDPYPDYPRSSWVDVASPAEGKWVPAQGAALATIMRRLHVDGGVRLKEIYALSPFREVADRCQTLVREEFAAEIAAELAAAGLDSGAEHVGRFIDTHVGTVHTMQGKEADVVLFVLGTDPSSGKGARDWAAQPVNLLNVAVSRARRRLFVIGSHAEWSAAPNFAELAARLPRHPWHTNQARLEG